MAEHGPDGNAGKVPATINALVVNGQPSLTIDSQPVPATVHAEPTTDDAPAVLRLTPTKHDASAANGNAASVRSEPGLPSTLTYDELANPRVNAWRPDVTYDAVAANDGRRTHDASADGLLASATIHDAATSSVRTVKRRQERRLDCLLRAGSRHDFRQEEPIPRSRINSLRRVQ